MPFIAQPKIRFLLNIDEVRHVNNMIAPFGGLNFLGCIGALNWRSIRMSGWMYGFTYGEPSATLEVSNTTTGVVGTIFDKKPMRVIINRNPKAWGGWLHFCRILIHEFEGHGTNEFGKNLGNGGHTTDRFAMMSNNPYSPEYLNPFLPVAGGGYVWWGLTKYDEFQKFQRIAGTPIWRD